MVNRENVCSPEERRGIAEGIATLARTRELIVYAYPPEIAHQLAYDLLGVHTDGQSYHTEGRGLGVRYILTRGDVAFLEPLPTRGWLTRRRSVQELTQLISDEIRAGRLNLKRTGFVISTDSIDEYAPRDDVRGYAITAPMR